MTWSDTFLRTLRFASLTLAAVAAGCGSSATVNYDSGVGGPVAGELDNHCAGMDPIVVNELSCHPDAGAPAAAADGGAAAEAGIPEPPAAVHFNAEADDDDCKYHVKFMITAAKQGQNTTLRVTVTHLADGTPALGAHVDIESYLADNDVHVIPNNGTTTAETPSTGVYTLSPVKFDVAGRWLLRFHLYETCSDANEDSPHGHVAFYVDVAP